MKKITRQPFITLVVFIVILLFSTQFTLVASEGENLVVVTSSPGRIVVNHDEWTFTDERMGDNGKTFALNVAKFFKPDGAGKFLAFSGNFALIGDTIRNTMESAGHQWVNSTSHGIFTLENLLTYDGVFLAGNNVDQQVLIDYVNAGGNVYVAAGTGWGYPDEEAAYWNTFLNTFGLNFASHHNDVRGMYPKTSNHSLLNGVDSLFFDKGNSVNELDPSNEKTDIIFHHESEGLIGIFDGSFSADSDGDGVPDSEDLCPGEDDRLDWDGDGIPDGCDDDIDGDGVSNQVDQCPETPLGEIVNLEGCSIEELCPCENDNDGNQWKNHGTYVKCVVKASKELYIDGLITKKEKKSLITTAAQSDCGK